MDALQSRVPNAAILDAVTQPALWISKDGTLQGNMPAQLLWGAGETLPPALREALEQEQTQLTLTLGGRRWEARLIYDAQGCTVLLAEAGQKLEPALLSMVARTLRQPASAMFSVAGTLFPALEDLDDPDIQRQTAMLNHSFYQLLRVVNNLSQAQDYLEGTAELCLSRVELGRFMQELARGAQPLVEAAGQKLEVLTPTALTTVYLDADRLRQALLELVCNAVKFSPAGSTIRLEAEAGPSLLLLRCRDQGPGMDPGLVGNLEKLAQVQGGVGDPRWGLGLGLDLALSVARLHGGTLLAHCPKEGGTELTMTIPRPRLPFQGELRSPAYDLYGGYDPYLIALADTLPSETFQSVDVN